MGCENACFELTFPCCESPAILNAGLTDIPLLAIVSIPGGTKIYRREVTVTDGGFELNKADFPDGFFVSRFLKIELRSGAPEYNTIQVMTFNSKPYNCLMLELADIDE